MPEQKSRAGEVAGKPKGARALFGAAMAIVGALAAVSPTNALLVALGDAVPRLAEALPPVITACGAIVGAMSDPPKLVRRKKGTAREVREGAIREDWRVSSITARERSCVRCCSEAAGGECSGRRSLSRRGRRKADAGELVTGEQVRVPGSGNRAGAYCGGWRRGAEVAKVAERCAALQSFAGKAGNRLPVNSKFCAP